MHPTYPCPYNIHVSHYYYDEIFQYPCLSLLLWWDFSISMSLIIFMMRFFNIHVAHFFHYDEILQYPCLSLLYYHDEILQYPCLSFFSSWWDFTISMSLIIFMMRFFNIHVSQYFHDEILQYPCLSLLSWWDFTITMSLIIILSWWDFTISMSLIIILSWWDFTISMSLIIFMMRFFNYASSCTVLWCYLPWFVDVFRIKNPFL